MIRSAIASSLLPAVAVLALAGAAPAQPVQASAGERTLAETLFREARELMAAERFADACAKLAESQRLDPGGGTLLNLALCHEKLGTTATAWGEYREALALARTDGRADRVRFAEERIRALEPELPRLLVHVPDSARVAGLKLALDGAPLRQAAWGVAFPVDPGKRVVRATAPGFEAWSTSIEMSARANQTIDVPRLTELPAAPTEPRPKAAPVADVDTGQRQRLVGYVVGGIGVAALGVGSYFGIQAIRKRSQSDDECPNERCTDEGVRLNDAAKKDANFANLGIGLGLVGVGVGTYLLLSSGGSPEEGKPRAPSAAFVPLRRGGAVSVRGVF